jgi:hypothetical protein
MDVFTWPPIEPKGPRRVERQRWEPGHWVTDQGDTFVASWNQQKAYIARHSTAIILRALYKAWASDA